MGITTVRWVKSVILVDHPHTNETVFQQPAFHQVSSSFTGIKTTNVRRSACAGAKNGFDETSRRGRCLGPVFGGFSEIKIGEDHMSMGDLQDPKMEVR